MNEENGSFVVRIGLELKVNLADECRGPGEKWASVLQWLVHVHKNRLTLTKIRVVDSLPLSAAATKRN